MAAQVQVLTLLDTIAIILGAVSFLIAILVFGASIVFFLQGQRLQNNANRTLVLIGEKSANIETTLEGMLDKTLDAALSRKEDVSEEFESLHKKLQKTAEEITKQVTSDIQGMGQQQRKELLESVKGKFSEISSQLRTAKESLSESMVVNIPSIVHKYGSVRMILRALVSGPMTISQIVEISSIGETLVVRRIDQLLELGLISHVKKNGKLAYRLSGRGQDVFRSYL